MRGYSKGVDKPLEEIDSELLTVFAHEAEDHLRTLNQRLPALIDQPGDQAVLQDIRRCVHTLKGCAAMVGFAELTRLAHRMEDLLDLLFEGERPITPEVTALLVAATDALEELASCTQAETPAGIYQRFDQILSGSLPPAPREPVPAVNIVAFPGAPPTITSVLPPRIDKFVRVPLESLDELVRLGNELVRVRGMLEQQMSHCTRQIEELQLGTENLRREVGKLQTFRSHAPTARQDFEERELDRCTAFHLLSQALSESTADIGTMAEELDKRTGEFESVLRRQAQLSRDIHHRLLRLRQVPFEYLSSRLQRTVRGVARAQKKNIRLVLEGEATELDKLVLEEMAEPLLHLLRNAADHGIEMPEQRRALGKTETGMIRVRASQENNQVIIEISDDGAGIDLGAVRSRALREQAHGARLGGLVGSGAGETMSDEELFALLFRPGFSTARQVSPISGRGMGLDIVKTRVEQLQGTITLASQPGLGSTFTIRLPVTLA